MKSLNETTQLVRDEHKKLSGLLRQLEGLDPRTHDFYYSVIDELCSEIQVYVELEERVLFPRLHREIKKRAGGSENPESESIHQSLSDHAEIVRQLREVRVKLAARCPPSEGLRDNIEDGLEESLEELRSLMEAYMYGEERALLPLMERAFPRLDAELSMKWFDTADEIRARIGATQASQPTHAQNPRGGEQRRKSS